MDSLFCEIETGHFYSEAEKIRNDGILNSINLLSCSIEADFHGEWDLSAYLEDYIKEQYDTNKYIEKIDGKETYNYSKHTSKIIKNISETIRKINTIDPDYNSQQFILYHDNSKFRFRPLAVWGINKLQEDPLPDGSTWMGRTNVVQSNNFFSEEAIEHLEELINNGSPERFFQDFFEKHPEFLLSLGNYKAIHPQIILHEDKGSLIPDIFIEKINSDFCDIIDLKKPTFELVRNQKNRTRFRDRVMEGIAQLNRYRNWFEDSKNRNLFHKKHGLNAYKPRTILIIGRNNSFYDYMIIWRE